jgi:protein-S-isoprenylcysteine O-methyltransferase Ste14
MAGPAWMALPAPWAGPPLALPWPWPALVGGALMLLGAAWLAWAAWSLKRAGNPLRHGAPPAVLVDSGPYRVSRHPMVLGGAVLLLGAAHLLAQPALLVLDAAWLLAMLRWVIPAEEARLAQAFGGWWRDYAQATRRIV